MKCNKIMCPMQHDTVSDDCDLKGCPYRTEDIEPEVIRALCNYIADLVVQKLKDKNNITDFEEERVEE